MNAPQKSFDLELFAKTKHNPSYASLTNHFKDIGGLKDYCIPVNSYFPPPGLLESLQSRMPYALKYYPSANENICENIAEFADIDDPETVIAGNGSTEIISWLNSIFFKDNLMVPIPSFGRWTEEPQGLGLELHTMQYMDKHHQHLSASDLVDEVKQKGSRNLVICNPNNPSGSMFSWEEILWILDSLPELDNIVIDESFIDFSSANPPSIKNDVQRYENAWVLKSLGKNLGLHGLRMGFAISNRKNIQKMRKHLPYWNINGITELLLEAIKNEKQQYEVSRLKTIRDTKYLARKFQSLSFFRVFPTNANFIFTKLDARFNGSELRDRLMQNHACFIRNCGNKVGSTQQYFRIASRPKEDVDSFIEAVTTELNEMQEAMNEPELLAQA